MAVRIVLVLFIIGCLNTHVYGASSQSSEDLIDSINEQLTTANNPREQAKLYCYRARNYAKAGEQGKAKDDYLRAINISYEGWILNELGHFMYKNGEYEKAYNVANKVLADFPQYQKEAVKLRDQAKSKWEEDYLKNNPPTITIDTAPDPNRVTRHDVIEQSESRYYPQSSAQPYKSSKSKTYKGSGTNSTRSGSGGSHISGFGTGSDFRQNYKKSRQGQ